MDKTANMKTPVLMSVSAATALSICACGGGDTPRTAIQADKCAPPLSHSVEARFEKMSGPLGCASTTSVIPDPPEGCTGVTDLLRVAKEEYAYLDARGGCGGSPPDLAPLLRDYERTFAAEHPFVEHRVERDGFSIAAREFGAELAGKGPTVVLMHGFPDNQHLYDRVAPLLGEKFRTITFDFVGWGASTSPPPDYTFTVESLRADLDAVMAYFAPESVVPVVHDASGWPGIDWALDNEDKVAALVLLNTTYYPIPGLKPPYVIRALAASDLRATFLDALGDDALMNRALFRAQVGSFFTDGAAKETYLPVLEASIMKARAGLVGLTENLAAISLGRSANMPRMQAYSKPVTVAFGEDDPFLNTTVAEAFAGAFPRSELRVISSASHYVQLDQPVAVVDAIAAAATRATAQ
jgi:haloalkane dehalogenase